MSTTTQPPKPNRRWYQFSLKTEDAMKRSTTWMLPIALLLVVGTPAYSAEPDENQDAAIAAIKKLGGQFTFYEVGGIRRVIKLELFNRKGAANALKLLTELADLQMLDLSGTNFTDADLKHLNELKSLTYLSLKRTKVTNAGLEHLKGMTKLKVLILDDNAVNGAGLKHLKEMTKLQSLSLMYTDIADDGLEHLKGLSDLHYLNLNYTHVSDAGLEHLKEMTQLHVLQLIHANATDEGTRKLGKALPECFIIKLIIK